MTRVTIRTAVPKDIPTIVRIAEHGWNATYGEFLAQETIDTAMTELYDPDKIREWIEHEDIAYFVAEQNNDILGYISCGSSGEETIATLGAVYVDPDHWGNGIGTVLLKEFEDYCRQHEYKTIQVQVLTKNEIGLSFYQGHGYGIIDKQVTNLFGETVRECELRR